MTEAEALRIGREAVQAATRKFGDDKKAIDAELDKRAGREPKLFEAFAIAGHLIVSAGQEQKH